MLFLRKHFYTLTLFPTFVFESISITKSFALSSAINDKNLFDIFVYRIHYILSSQKTFAK